MADSKDYRKRVMEYLEEGHTQAEAQKVFKVGSTPIKGRKKLRLETGSLEKRELKRQARVYDSEGLRTYIEEHPQATLKEIANHFGGSIPGADNALKREKITKEKRHLLIVKEAKKSERSLTRK